METGTTCTKHAELMQLIGRIDERTETMKTGIEQLNTKVNLLTVNGEVQKVKMNPIFWVITTIAGSLIVGGVGYAFKAIGG